jgi:hypothetical protein
VRVEAVGDLTCAECGRKPGPDENAADEWRAYLDVDDELPVFCPECAERERRNLEPAVTGAVY